MHHCAYKTNWKILLVANDGGLSMFAGSFVTLRASEGEAQPLSEILLAGLINSRLLVLVVDCVFVLCFNLSYHPYYVAAICASKPSTSRCELGPSCAVGRNLRFH